jgi:hypothetical protein
MADNSGDTVVGGRDVARRVSTRSSSGRAQAATAKMNIIPIHPNCFIPAKVNKKPRHGNRSGEKMQYL